MIKFCLILFSFPAPFSIAGALKEALCKIPVCLCAQEFVPGVNPYPGIVSLPGSGGFLPPEWAWPPLSLISNSQKERKPFSLRHN